MSFHFRKQSERQRIGNFIIEISEFLNLKCRNFESAISNTASQLPPATSASNQKKFVPDDSVELVRAGRIPGEAAHAFAIAAFARIQGLRRFKTFLGFSEPVHLQAQQSELVMSLTKLRIQFRGLSQMLDGAPMLSRAVVNRANQKMHWRAGLQLDCGIEMFDGLLSLPDRGEQRTKRCVGRR